MTREIIEDFRLIVIPYMVNRLEEINYEGQGGSDAKEFMSSFNEICDLAIKALGQEPQTFKWCTDCKEYDQEKHCCHRWSKVIRDTVEEMKQEPKTGHWVHGEYCSECGCDVPAYIIDWKWQKDMDAKYCPNCGAKMVNPQESEDKG